MPRKSRSASALEDESLAALDAQVGSLTDAPYSDADDAVDDSDDTDDTDDDDSEEDGAEDSDDDSDDADDAPEPDATGQLPLVQEGPQATKLITALKLDTPAQVRSVAKALEKRAIKLGDLSKKLREEGKDDEAKSVDREVTMIRETLSSQLKSQGALAFNERETLPQAVSRLFQAEFRYKLRAALTRQAVMRAGETRKDAEERQLDRLVEFEGLVGQVGEIGGMLVVSWLTNVADRAYEKGKIAHEATPSNIAREALQALEIELQGREQ